MNRKERVGAVAVSVPPLVMRDMVALVVHLVSLRDVSALHH